jgi:hypothetical protein
MTSPTSSMSRPRAATSVAIKHLKSPFRNPSVVFAKPISNKKKKKKDQSWLSNLLSLILRNVSVQSLAESSNVGFSCNSIRLRLGVGKHNHFGVRSINLFKQVKLAGQDKTKKMKYFDHVRQDTRSLARIARNRQVANRLARSSRSIASDQIDRSRIQQVRT